VRVLKDRVQGSEVQINVVENEDDAAPYIEWAKRNPNVAFDTEGTGLYTFAPDFRLRLAQFGNEQGTEAWVIPVEHGPRYEWLARTTLENAHRVVVHNLPYDSLVVDQHLGVSVEHMYSKGMDTGILSRLVDSRGKHEGGFGHRLEDLAEHFIDPRVAKEVKGSVNDQAKALRALDKGKPRAEKQWVGLKKDNFYRRVPLDYEPFLRYAGMDTILAARAANSLIPLVPPESRRLVPYEHELAMIATLMVRMGIAVDVEYAREQSEILTREEERHMARAAKLGLENVNSHDQVVERLLEMGWEPIPNEKTDNGSWQAGKVQLNRLMEQGDKLGEIAHAIYNAKRAGKWNSAYFKTIIDRAVNGRVHPNINTMIARTARWSVTKPAVQTLPSGLAYVRNAFLAEEGEQFWSVDYAGMELRDLAAESGDAVMIKAFELGQDLHAMTAMAAFGDQYDEDRHRPLGKTTNFGGVYGGGAQAIHDQTGVPLEIAAQLIKGFKASYPGVQEFSKRLQKEARDRGYVVTRSGRRLYVDRHRAYSALNYRIQSFCRDIMGAAVVRANRAGLTPYVRMVVHDEMVGSTDDPEVVHEISRLMNTEVSGVQLPTDVEIGGRSWGTLMKDKQRLFMEEDEDEQE
jgi:DNA polymerase-1